MQQKCYYQVRCDLFKPNFVVLTIKFEKIRSRERKNFAGKHFVENNNDEESSYLMENVLKYRKVTRPGIEPKIFWTYTKCFNQLSYLALEFNQLILYLCNCQPKDTYSIRHIQCHSLHARSTLWPWYDQISQSGNHVTDYIIQCQHHRTMTCDAEKFIIICSAKLVTEKKIYY